MISAAIFLAVAWQGQADVLQQRFSFESPAATVSRVLASLSSATGTTLTVSGPISKDILILSFRDAPLGQVLGKIGQATSASWTSRKGGFVLSRSSRDVASINEELRSELRGPLRALLDEVSQYQDGVGPLTYEKARAKYEKQQDEQQRRSFDDGDGFHSSADIVRDYDQEVRDVLASKLEFDAGSRFALRLLRTLGADELAKLCAGSHKDIVLATDPTKLQRPLTVTASQWRQFVAEHNASVAAYESVYPKEEEEEGTIVYSGWRRFGPGSTLAAEMPRKVILELTPRIYDRPELWVQLSCFGQDGSSLVGGYSHLVSLQARRPESRESSKGVEEAPLEISPLGRAFADLTRWNRRDDHSYKPDPTLLQQLMKPDVYEPLSLLASEALIKASAQRGRNLAACLPDSYAVYGFGMEDRKAGAASVLEYFEGTGPRLADADGWFTIRLEDPQWETECRLNRSALAQLIQTAVRTDVVTIDDYAAYAARTNNDTEGIANSICDAELHSLKSDAIFDSFWLAKFYGSLSPLQRLILKRGGRVYLGELPPSVKETLLRFFIEEDQLELQEDYPESDYGSSEPTRLYSDLALERTQFFAYGLEPSGWIGLKAESEPDMEMIYFDAEGRSVGTNSSDESVALLLYMQKHPELSGTEPDPIDYSKASFHPRTRMSANFKFHVAPYVTCSASLMHTFEDPKDAFTLENLPADLRQRLAEFFKRFDQQVKDGEIGPPPPARQRQ